MGAERVTAMRFREQGRAISRYKIIVVCIWILAAGLCCSITKQGADAKRAEREPELCRDNYLSEAAARHQLAEFARSYSNLRQWRSRAKRVRDGILRGAELLNPPKRCALNPIIHSRREHKGYTVENVAFESLPGFFVTGNLYRPLAQKGPFAGILCPHGHFFDPNGGGGRFRASQQIRCAMFARMGAVVLSYDMAGWGESNQCSHNHPEVLALQLWSSMRGIDFLMSLKGVDSKRIGITGASGGGFQTFAVAAIDDRIAVSIPVVKVSAHDFCSCICCNGMPIHRSAAHETNNAEIAALAAPRPQLIISCGADSTRNTPEVEFPYIQNVYRLYGAEEKVENLHLADEGHDYGPSKRAGAYRFFAKHLGLSFDNVTKPDGTIDESGVVVEKVKDMRVFSELNEFYPPKHPRPEHAVTWQAIKALLNSKQDR